MKRGRSHLASAVLAAPRRARLWSHTPPLIDRKPTAHPLILPKAFWGINPSGQSDEDPSRAHVGPVSLSRYASISTIGAGFAPSLMGTNHRPTYPGPRSTCPGSSPVGSPSAMIATPFTKTQGMPVG